MDIVERDAFQVVVAYAIERDAGSRFAGAEVVLEGHIGELPTLGDHGCADVLKREIADHALGSRRRVGGAAIVGIESDGNRASDVAHDQVRERDVLQARAGADADLDGAAVGVVDDAVGDRDVFTFAVAEAEDRPTGAEGRIGDSDELLLPKSAQASSWHMMLQLTMLTY